MNLLQLSTTLLIALLLVALTTCFNISPSPNIVITKPSYRSLQTQSRSSYFGYSLNLRKSSIMIGAPRAESGLDAQRKIKEPGVIFKCRLSDTLACNPFDFDRDGDKRFEQLITTHDSEDRTYQFLGAAMDGSESENDRFVVCAPLFKSPIGPQDDTIDTLLHGICYWVNHTRTQATLSTWANNLKSFAPSAHVYKISPLRDKKMQYLNRRDGNRFQYYSHGESGFSVHITDDQSEIIVGSPGISIWQGSVILYSSYRGGFISRVPIPLSHLGVVSYFGYAVSSGKFNLPTSSKLFYVASAPRADESTVAGEVYIFDIIFENSPTPFYAIKVQQTFYGSQMGEYFGYALLTDDFNNDNLPDLAVAAPLHSNNATDETGAVYIYINQGDVNYFRI